MEKCIIKIGIVGIGVMGLNHLRVLTELDGVKVAAICDQNSEMLEKVRKRFHIDKSFTDAAIMLDQGSLDALIVSSSTPTHYEIAKLSILRGIPVLVEKPIALTVEQGQELVDLANARNVPLFVGYVERFNPVITQLRTILNQGLCGAVQHVNISRVNSFPLRMARCHIGVVTDLSTHDIDLLQFITEQTVTSLHAKVRYQTTYDVYAQTSFSLTQGISASCEWSWINPYRRRTVEVVCEEGTLVANLAKQSLFFHKRPKMDMDTGEVESNFFKALEFNSVEAEVTKYAFRKEEPLKLELADFVNAVREGRRSSCQYAVDILQIMNAIYESDQENKIVNFLPETAQRLQSSLAIASPGVTLQAEEFKKETIQEDSAPQSSR